MEQEIWKNIPWFEGRYQASNIGNIKSFYDNKNKYREKILKQSYCKWYLIISIRENSLTIRKNYKVHRLIAKTFIPNIENKLFVNHKNWIKDDNRLENLEWCTQSENELHKFRVLLANTWKWKPNIKMKWWKHPISKKVIQYDINWNLLKLWECAMDIKLQLNYCNSWIWKACKNWKIAYWFIWKYA